MAIVRIDPEAPRPEILRMAGEYLRKGEVVVHPTETVYGLAGQYLNEAAIGRIVQLKRRAPAHPFSIMVAGVPAILEISGWRDAWLADLLNRLLPDALTVLLPRRRELPLAYWNRFPLLGFRYPRHPLSLALIHASKSPVITTSANISGEAPPTQVSEISPIIMNKVNLVLDGGPTPLKVPSTIVQIDPEQKQMKLIRPGAVSLKRIEKEFGAG